ncbi:hypothetical protein C8Q74DRAFT_420803 [Fomes fomentarius]|nr:hypothetical protein C8Q74DRAFT_420803 [Fomes fomentarius]
MVTFLCRHRSLRGLASLLFIAVCATAASVNRTIDDELGDSVTGVVPSYSPVGSWSQGATCDRCWIQLDHDQAFKGTWHDTTHTPGDPEPRLVTAQFAGTAVYVYCVIANAVPNTTTLTNLTFTLDGQQVGTYVHVPTDSTAFQYDVPVYTNPSLSNGDHTLVIEATGDTASSLVLFDYIVYTFDEEEPLPSSASPPSTTTSSSTPDPTPFAANTPQHGTAFPVGAVAGGVSGGVVLIALAAVFLLCYKRRQRASREALDDPFIIDDDGKSTGGVVSVFPSAWTGRANMAQVDDAASHIRLFNTPPNSQPGTPPANMSSPSVHPPTVPTGDSSVALHPHMPNSSRRAMRPAPDVPSSPSDFAPTTVYDHDQYTAMSIPPVQIYETSTGLSEPDAPPPRPGHRVLPVPPARELDSPVCSASTSTSNPGPVTVLRTQVAALREEMLRLQQEQGLLAEAPPRYNEVRV